MPPPSPSPPNLSVIASTWDPLVSWKPSLHQQRLFAQAKFGQRVSPTSDAPASPWVGSGKPHGSTARGPRSWKKKKAKTGKKIKCLITVLSVTGLYSFSLFCLIQLPSPPSREKHLDHAAHTQPSRRKNRMLYTSPWGWQTGHFTINVYALIRRNLSEKGSSGYLNSADAKWEWNYRCQFAM